MASGPGIFNAARHFARIAILAISLAGLAAAALTGPTAALADPRLPGEACHHDPQLDWTEPEIWTWVRVCEGETADFNELYDQTLDPKSPDGWAEDRELSPAFLETVLLHDPFRGAQTRKGVRIIGAWFRKPIDLDNARLERKLWLDQSRFESGVDFFGLKSSSYISLRGSKFTGKLNMAGMKVEGGLFMYGGAEFNEVVLRGAKIGGQLNISESKFNDKLNMNHIEVGAMILMRGGNFAGFVNLRFATIAPLLDLSGANFSSLDLTGVRIDGELRLGSEELRLGSKKIPKFPLKATVWDGDGESKLILRNTLAGAVQYREGAWPKNLELDGFEYNGMVGYDVTGQKQFGVQTSKKLIEWLKKDKSFSPQPYEQLASVLRVAGHDGKASDILFAGKERERADAKGFKWFGLTLLTYSIGYGYGFRYFYSLIWIGVLVAVGAFVLRATGESKRLRMPYGISYSLDMLLPIIRLREWHYDEVDLRSPARYYFYFHKLMGYVLASFLIAGLSGLTK